MDIWDDYFVKNLPHADSLPIGFLVKLSLWLTRFGIKKIAFEVCELFNSGIQKREEITVKFNLNGSHNEREYPLARQTVTMALARNRLHFQLGFQPIKVF